MPYALRRLFHLLPMPHGSWSLRRWRPGRIKTAAFAAFTGTNAFQLHTFDQYERSARRWRMAKWSLFWLSAFLAAWIFLESLRALTLA